MTKLPIKQLLSNQIWALKCKTVAEKRAEVREAVESGLGEGITDKKTSAENKTEEKVPSH